MRIALSILFALFAAASTYSQENDGSVRLPNEGYSPEYERVIQHAQLENASSQRWLGFKEKHGDWRAFWNEWTGTPYRVWGEGYQIPGISRVDSSNADAAARLFIGAFEDLLRCDARALRLVNANEYDGKWTVSYEQLVDGIRVLNSDVTVTMNDRGRVFMFGSEFQPEIGVSTTPTIDREQARLLAATGLVMRPGGIDEASGSELALLPYSTSSGMTHRLVYDFTVPQDEFHIWETLVDAHDGTVLQRRNRVTGGIGGTVTSNVKTVSYTQTGTVVPNTDQYVTVASANTTTNGSGVYSSSNSGTVTMKFEGPYCKISRQDGSNSVITQVIANNSTYNVEWNNTNSTAAERTAFQTVNRSRRYILDMDPAITSLNYQVLTKVNLPQTCNANFDGNGLNFYTSGTSTLGPCPKAAEMPDVVMHEYGHLVNRKVYIEFGKSNGMTNGSLNEGVADANASFQLDRPEMGVGFFGTNTVLRNLDNTNRYPRDITGEVHNDGMIMGGALWDMRVNIGLAQASRVMHFARRGKPDDSNTGKAFTKYFLEILKVDDNDANLANGTPNSAGIVAAFAKHGIPSGLLTITHAKQSSAAANTAIPVTCTVVSALTDISTSQVRVHYRPDGGRWLIVNMTKTGGQNNGTSNWSGTIPGQPAGTVLEYFIEAAEAWGSSLTHPADGSAVPHMVLVGFTRNVLFDFETAAGWTGHIPGDQAVTGRWVRVDPVGTFVNSSPVQPEDDHSPTGTFCWVTGNGAVNGAAGDQDVDDGETTLLSPVLNLSNLSTPVIRYWRWFSNNLGASPGGDPWVVQISSDNGSSWFDVENTTLSDNSWSERVAVVSRYVTPTSEVRLRFVARDDDPQSLVEAAVDDVEVLYVSVVPVELSRLSAVRSADGILARWRTESETNNHGFEVQFRVEGGADWTTAAFVPGAGNSATPLEYSRVFDPRSAAPLHVRLRQIDNDGSATTSQSVFVAAGELNFTLRGNHPNPFTSRTTVTFDLSEASEVRIIISNTLGAEVLRYEALAMPPGAHGVRLDMTGLPSGVYQCQVIAGERQGTFPMLLAR